MWPSYTVIALYLKSGVERERGRRKVGSVPKQSVLALYVVREGGEIIFLVSGGSLCEVASGEGVWASKSRFGARAVDASALRGA